MVATRLITGPKELSPGNFLQVLERMISLKKLYLPEEELDEKLAFLDDQLFDEILPALNRSVVERKEYPVTA